MPTFNTTDPKPGYVYDSSNDTWYPLLGIAPASQVDRWTKTAAGGETSLSGNDDNAVSLSYTSGTEQVYLNGVLLVRGQDYTATNGTTITGLTALAASDVAEVVTFNPSNIITTDAVISTDFEAKGDLISASAASTPIRLPVGTNGHVLKANSATTSGLEWAASAADIEGVTAGTGLTGGGTSGTVTLALDSTAVIAPTIVDAKGDIIAASAADTVARLAVGANDTVLTADSTAATGLKWATPAAGGMTLLSTTALSGTSTTVSSISQAYNQLYIIIQGVWVNTGTPYLRIEANTTANVYYGGITSGAATASTTEIGTNASVSLFTASTNAARTNVHVKFLNYSQSSYQKAWSLFGQITDASASAFYGGGGVALTSAITSITAKTSNGTSTFSGGQMLIYGVK